MCAERLWVAWMCQESAAHFGPEMCSGKRECAVQVPDPEMTAEIPCIEELSPYLEAQYKCQAGKYTLRFWLNIFGLLFIFGKSRVQHLKLMVIFSLHLKWLLQMFHIKNEFYKLVRRKMDVIMTS